MRERIAWLRRFRQLVAGSMDPLARLISEETGKPVWEAVTADLLSLLAACRWHEKTAPRILREKRVGRDGSGMMGLTMRIRERRCPLGAVAIIATWNYPVQLLGIQLVQALIAGNRVVVKPSEHAPRTQQALLHLAVEAGLPEGVLTWVESTREAGARLIADQDFDHIVFTGSTSVGRAIASVAADRLIPTTLELSGQDSAFVLDDGDATLAARSIWNAVAMNGGQTCMAPRRVLVVGDVYAKFLAALAPLAAGARPRRLISESAAVTAYDHAKQAITAGGRSISGVCEPPVGAALIPIAIVDCPASASLVRGEHFGPVVAVVRCRTVDEALAVHHACDKHLAASIFTRDAARAGRLAGELRSSIVTINDCVLPAAHPATSIGGRGLSGWGVSRGREGLLAMTRPVFVTRTGSLFRTPVDEPTSAGRTRLIGWLKWLYGAPRASQSMSMASAAATVDRHDGKAARVEVACCETSQHTEKTST